MSKTKALILQAKRKIQANNDENKMLEKWINMLSEFEDDTMLTALSGLEEQLNGSSHGSLVILSEDDQSQFKNIVTKIFDDAGRLLTRSELLSEFMISAKIENRREAYTKLTNTLSYLRKTAKSIMNIAATDGKMKGKFWGKVDWFTIIDNKPTLKDQYK